MGPIVVWVPVKFLSSLCQIYFVYRGADKSLARPGRKKLMSLSEWREFPSVPCRARKKKKRELDDRSRLDVVEIARVPDMLPSLFPSWSG